MMNPKWLRLLGYALTLFLLTMGCSSEKQPDEKQTARDVSPKTEKPATTAGDILGLARETARQRAADAALVHVDSQQRATFADGRSQTWEFRFYSPAKDDEFVVIMENRQVRKVRTSGGGYRKPIPDGWMDSDLAAQKVELECAGTAQGTYFFMLLATADGQSAKWGISCGEVGERRYIMVDAFSGEILSVKDSW
jgi:hypothetical protein